MSLRSIAVSCIKNGRVHRLALGCSFFISKTDTDYIRRVSELSDSFKQFNISPLELKLSANYVAQPYSYSIKKLRLPTLDRLNAIIENPCITTAIMEMPFTLNIPEKFDPTPFASINDPELVIKKEAVRMIVIRRKKMKKHKLRKLRKKMKFLWQKRRQKREYAKELLFQSEQMAKLRSAEAFDAVKYVRDKLAELNEVPIPRTWKGRKLPQIVIKNLMIDPLFYKHFKYPYRKK